MNLESTNAYDGVISLAARQAVNEARRMNGAGGLPASGEPAASFTTSYEDGNGVIATRHTAMTEIDTTEDANALTA